VCAFFFVGINNQAKLMAVLVLLFAVICRCRYSFSTSVVDLLPPPLTTGTGTVRQMPRQRRLAGISIG
jgi:hypothetical protein